jgi:hypothetical protein
MRHAPIAVAGKFQSETLNRVAQIQVAFGTRVSRGMRVVATPAYAEQLAEPTQRKSGKLFLEDGNHSVLFPDGVGVLREACCARLAARLFLTPRFPAPIGRRTAPVQRSGFQVVSRPHRLLHPDARAAGGVDGVSSPDRWRDAA